MEPTPEPTRGDAEAEEGGRRGGCLLFLIATGACYWLLRDFTSTVAVAMLAPLAAALGYAGLYLATAALRYVFESPWYAGLWVLGLVMLAGAGAALSPAAPGRWLEAAPPFWGILESRAARLESAIEEGDIARARTLAKRGLGDPGPVDRSGTPLLHLTKDAEMIGVLLDAGLDPDVRDEGGNTLLMRSGDPAVVRLLLASGADPNARNDNGFTPLMGRRNDPAENLTLLLEAGADVHAANDAGRTVADLVHGPGRALLTRYAGGRALVETGGVTPRGRDDWLLASPGPVGRPDASAVALLGEPLRPGDVGTLSVVLDNPTPRDRVLEVEAVLDNAILFVAASHDGAVDDRGRPGLSSEVRWPWLSLPAGAQGRLEVTVLVRPDDLVTSSRTENWNLDVRVVDVPERTESLLHFSQERAGAPARVGLDDPAAWVGPLLFVGLVFVGWLSFGRRRRGESSDSQAVRIGRVVAGLCGLLCLVVAGNVAWSMAEPYLGLEETSCEILDHRVIVTEVVSTSSNARVGITRRNEYRLQGHPVAAVAIDVGGERRVTAGWALGGTSRSVSELRVAPIGSTSPCWVDPENPERFTLIRSPSTGGIVGLPLLLVTAVPLLLIAWRFGRGGDEPAD